jgi:hypothetical protein
MSEDREHKTDGRGQMTEIRRERPVASLPSVARRAKGGDQK